MLMRAISTYFAHETSGAARIRHSLRPLDLEGVKITSKPRAQCVAGSRNCIFRHCEEHLRRSNPYLRMPRYGLLRFARNDAERPRRTGLPLSRRATAVD